MDVDVFHNVRVLVQTEVGYLPVEVLQSLFRLPGYGVQFPTDLFGLLDEVLVLDEVFPRGVLLH